MILNFHKLKYFPETKKNFPEIQVLKRVKVFNSGDHCHATLKTRTAILHICCKNRPLIWARDLFGKASVLIAVNASIST